MKRVFFVLFLILLIGCATKEEVKSEDSTPVEKINEIGGENMRLVSDDFQHNGMIPAKFTCQGEDINPELAWSDVPAGTKSFALIMDDPDAPMGTWVHWLVKDIPANVKEIKQNSIPGTQVVNSFGKEDYGGPCPPSGVHRYFFKLYALSVPSFDASGKADFYKKVEQYKVGEAVLMGKYIKR